MTTALLQTLPKPPAGACVLDACCGSGAIAAALRHAPDGGALRVHLLDADAVAMHAAKLNVPDAARHWHGAIWPQREEVGRAAAAEARRFGEIGEQAGLVACGHRLKD